MVSALVAAMRRVLAVEAVGAGSCQSHVHASGVAPQLSGTMCSSGQGQIARATNGPKRLFSSRLALLLFHSMAGRVLFMLHTCLAAIIARLCRTS